MTSAPADPAARRRQVEALIDLRRFEQASQELQAAIAADPEEPTWWCLMTRAQLGLERLDAALSSAQRAVALGPDLEWPHRLLSIVCQRVGRFGDGVAEARIAVALAPLHWHGHVTLAEALLHATPDRREALAEAERACELAPDSPDAHIVRGRVLLVDGRADEAQAAYRKALELDPQNAVARNNLAAATLGRTSTMSTSRQLASAAEGFATAVRTDPRLATSRRNIDVVVNGYLYRASWLLFVVAAASTLFTKSSAVSLVARLTPVALLVVPLVFALRFVLHLSPAMRLVVRSTVRRTQLFVAAVVADVGAMALIVASAAVPAAARLTLLRTAWALALLGGVLVLIERSRRRAASAPAPAGTPVRATLGASPGHPDPWRTPVARKERDYARPPQVRTPYLWLLVGCLIFFVVLSLAFAIAPLGLASHVVGAVGAVVFGAAAVLLIRRLRDR